MDSPHAESCFVRFNKERCSVFKCKKGVDDLLESFLDVGV